MLIGIYRHLGAWSDRVARGAYGGLSRGGPDFLPLFRNYQLRSITSLTTVMMAANLVNVLAFATLELMVHRMSVADWIWATLVAVMALETLRRDRRRHKRRHSGRTSSRTIGKLVFSAIILGLVWTWPLTVIASGGTKEEIAFIAALTAGMIAGGSLALYPVPVAVMAYTGTLTLAAIPAISLGFEADALPFALMAAMFFIVVVVSVARHHRIFVEEFRSRLGAEFERELRDLLIGNVQTRTDTCIWQADETMTLMTSTEPIRRILRWHGASRAESLPQLLAESGVRVADPEYAEAFAALTGLGAGETAGPMLDDFCLRLLVRTDAGESEGGERMIDLVGRRIVLEENSGIYFNGYFKDVTEEMQALAEAQRLATHDHMTALPNHGQFMRESEALIAARVAEGGAWQAAMFFIDADNLKRTNDGFGHAAGDALLVAVAARLAARPGQAIACRKGGDEFVLFELHRTEEEIHDAAMSLQQELNGLFSYEGRKLPMRCTIGSTHCAAGDRDLTQLEFEADVALMNQKLLERSRLGAYAEEMGVAHTRETHAALALRQAIAGSELTLEYQPIVTGDGGHVWAVEALLRWHHPDLGTLPPPKVIEIAASEGISTELSEYIIATALRECRDLPGEIAISINVSATEIDRPDFAASLLRLAALHQTAPERIWLEITEEQFLPRNETVKANISLLRARGVKLALDDFGSGYSTLSNLDDVDCDVIKIDRSLVHGCQTRPNSLTMIVSLCAVSQSIGRIVVLEGIEEQSEIEVLRVTGSQHFQGFLFHRPLPIAALIATISGRSASNDVARIAGT